MVLSSVHIHFVGVITWCHPPGADPGGGLLQLRIPQEVGAKYKIFGTFLLDDKRGNRVDSIKIASLGEPEDIVTRILQEWVGGRGAVLSWHTLVKTLRDCELAVLADQIQATKTLQCRPI